MREKNNPQEKSRKYVIILSAVVAALLASNAILLFKNRDAGGRVESASGDKYNLLNPARKLIAQKDLIINFQPLRDYLNDKYEADQNVSIYFEYLPTGASISINKDDKFGTLYQEPSNTTHTIEDLVRRSLSDSDNSAHFILVRNLEMEEMKDVYDHMGLKGFLETEGSLSAKRYSVMIRALHSA